MELIQSEMAKKNEKNSKVALKTSPLTQNLLRRGYKYLTNSDGLPHWDTSEDVLSSKNSTLTKKMKEYVKGGNPDISSEEICAQLTATTPALTQEGEDEHTLSSEACVVSRLLFFTLRTHRAATQELQHRRTTQLSGSLQASPQAPGQTTGVAGAWRAKDTLADLTLPPSPGRRSANCAPPSGSSRPRSAWTRTRDVQTIEPP
ncbi:uncharacterized protein LOC131698725 [Acipenser ruthenus]|uniref:uncharacterized protein LOC131698725 n=1 Tax=Acipenser ruthenus TaxID=7906 RepID=UPI002741C430|nr:uncharacterized protein LOC131698725 [Acipenser ruthenus]